MENKKQSSVEWLFFELSYTPKDKFEWHSILRQAKAMHRKEIEDAYGHGQNNGYMYANQRAIIISKENYFNQIFGGQDNE